MRTKECRDLGSLTTASRRQLDPRGLLAEEHKSRRLDEMCLERRQRRS